ncbi:MAG: triose-phosphate isomerase [Gaiellales bacterium]
MSSARALVAGNWKMFNGASGASRFTAELIAALPDDPGCDAVVCPPFVSLGAAVSAAEGSSIAVYAQNVHWADDGAFTGEVAAEMLVELGVAGSLTGHSERRRLFGETDEATAARTRHALDAGLGVIACVGELLSERDAGQTAEVLRRQVGAIASAVDEVDRLVVAYEPVWAIGTGKTATAGQAQEAHALIKTILPVRLLYGGSVKPENAAELMAMPDVDGALVGGASLEVDSFVAICAAAAAAS